MQLTQEAQQPEGMEAAEVLIPDAVEVVEPAEAEDTTEEMQLHRMEMVEARLMQVLPRPTPQEQIVEMEALSLLMSAALRVRLLFHQLAHLSATRRLHLVGM